MIYNYEVHNEATSGILGFVMIVGDPLAFKLTTPAKKVQACQYIYIYKKILINTFAICIPLTLCVLTGALNKA